MPATIDHRWTADEVRALPEEPGKRFEVVDGELLVSPGPSWPHQKITKRLLALLDEYAEASGVGTALFGPGEYELDTNSLVQPDVFVVPLVDGRTPNSQADVARPLLFIEALSPGTARHDRGVKRRRYQRAGIEYWIVDLDARLVERWLPEATQPEVLYEQVTWHPSSAVSPLVIELAPLFAYAFGE